jgi:hypothetical protein
MAEGEELGSNLLHAAGRGGRQPSVKTTAAGSLRQRLEPAGRLAGSLDRIDNPIHRRTAKFPATATPSAARAFLESADNWALARRSYSGFSGKRRGSANRPNYLAFATQVQFIFPLFVVIVVTPRPVVPVVTLRPIIPIVTPLVVAILTTSGRVVALFKNRATLSAELRSISP